MLNCFSPKTPKKPQLPSYFISRFKVGFNTENWVNEHISIANINEPVEHGVYKAGGLDRDAAAQEEDESGGVDPKEFPKAPKESEIEKLVAAQS